MKIDMHVLLPIMRMYTGQLCYEHQTSTKGANAARPSTVHHLRGQGQVDANNQRAEQNSRSGKMEWYP